MNYLKLCNRFWSTVMFTDTSTQEVSVYFLLLNACNCRGLKNGFELSTRQAIAALDISEKQFRSARARLAERGLLAFRPAESRSEKTIYWFGEEDSEGWTFPADALPFTHQNCSAGASKAADALRKKQDTYIDNTADDSQDSSRDDRQAVSQTAPESRTQKSPRKEAQAAPITAPKTAPIAAPLYIDKRKEIKENTSADAPCGAAISPLMVMNWWNEVMAGKAVPCVTAIAARSKREAAIAARIRHYGPDKVRLAINNVANSDFLNGINRRGFVANIDWVFAPSNFIKVLDGNYNNPITAYKSENYEAYNTPHHSSALAIDPRRGTEPIAACREDFEGSLFS